MRANATLWVLLTLTLSTATSCLDPNGRVPKDGADDEDTAAPDDTCDDTDTGPNDADGDGYTDADGDCDDSDEAVHPGAAEVCENGKDDDCDGSSGACVPTSRSLADADAKITGDDTSDYAGWAQSNNASFVEHANLGWVSPATWEVTHPGYGTVLFTFDAGSFGHLVYSTDKGETWHGMDVTYHPAVDDSPTSTWNTVWRRVSLIREGQFTHAAVYQRNGSGKFVPLKKKR